MSEARANPFPDLPPDEYDALLEDIEQRGMVYPVVRDQHGNTIDGHQRERACAALGIEPHYRVVVVQGEAEREALAVVLNTHRRQLTAAGREANILRLAGTGLTQAEIAAAVGVTQGRVSQVISANNPPPPDAPPPADPSDAPTDAAPPALDRQGRPPGHRGGRPRGAAVPAPIRPSIHVVMTAFRRDLTRLLLAYEEVAGDEEFAGAFDEVIEAMRRALQG